jgi:tRNA G46 methylase TrmB
MPTPLHTERLEVVHNAVRAMGARRIADLGCGDGDFLIRFAQDKAIDHITGVEISRGGWMRSPRGWRRPDRMRRRA